MIKRGKENVNDVVDKGLEIVIVIVCVSMYVLEMNIEIWSFDSLCGYAAACGVGVGGGFRCVQEPVGRTMG
jgi:hypothetical protein